jgi:FtsZ-binding cell division protein ZapB
MKKLIAILFLFLATFAFAQTKDVSATIAESNKLLQQALDRISVLETENKSLKDTNLSLQASLAGANEALKQSNVILQKASDRITADQEEIKDLRLNIKQLIDAGVEFQSYQWEIGVLIGYPFTAKLAVTWDPKWIPFLGFTGGFEYYFDTQKAGVFVGVKVNLK